MSFFEKILGSKEPSKKYESKITVEKIQHIFEYGKLKNLIGTGTREFSNQKLGNNMEWEAESKFRKAYKNIPEQTVPPHIK